MQLDTGNITLDLLRWKEKYLEEKTNNSCSSRTLEIYGRVLTDFVEYSRQYQGEAGIEDINRIFINGYLSERAKTARKFGSSSKKLHVSVLKAFFSFVTENNDENVDFEKTFKKMVIVRDTKVKPSVSEDELTKLLNYLEREKLAPRNRVINYRNSLLIKTMLYAGLREHELMPLRLKDFIYHEVPDDNSDFFMLLVKGKGDKERYVYIPADTISDELDTLKEDMGENWFVCSTRNRTIINRSNLWTIVSGIYKRAGVDKTGLHILRHTFARRLVANDVNLETIKELLGHASIATTSTFYAKTNEQNKRKAIIGTHNKNVDNKLSI